MNNELFNTNRWYLLSTKSRSEKIAENNLKNQGHETFLPMMALKKTKIKVFFPGYIFVKPKIGTSFISIKSTKGVKQFIKFGNSFPVVSDELVEFLKSRIYHFEKLVKNQNNYKKGQLVQIERGPFKDFEAIFESYDKEHNVFVLLRFLERVQKIKINEAYLN
tara:strand:- start:2269 stop:2757 length:489 start_codon:yes stop_codon:yes gene_type:complete